MFGRLLQIDVMSGTLILVILFLIFGNPGRPSLKMDTSFRCWVW